MDVSRRERKRESQECETDKRGAREGLTHRARVYAGTVACAYVASTR